MKRALFYVVCISLIQIAFAEPNIPDKNAQSIQYIQTAYPIYKLAGGNAAMLSEKYLANERTIEANAEIDAAKITQDDLDASIPTECTNYAEDMGSRFAITVKGKPEMKCVLAFQDVAYLKKDRQGKHPVMILGYKGCPFSIRELKVLSDISMRGPMIVDIGSADGNILRAAATSVLPFIVTSEFTAPCFTAVNMQWRFAKENMSFSTTKARYKTSKSGATISFTETGVKLDGVEETSNDGPNKPVIDKLITDANKTDKTKDSSIGWAPPEKRVYFAKEYGARMSIQQALNGKNIDCPLVYQDIAYKVDKDGKRTDTLTVSAYGGVAFVVPKEIKVQDDGEMGAEAKIEIEYFEKGIFITKKEDRAAVPFINTGYGLDPKCTMFRNVAWVFAKEMTFSTEKAKYAVRHPGATISFTKEGVKLDGVTKIDIETSENKNIDANVAELVRGMSIKGEKSADASIALIKLGSPAVPEICRALDTLSPALDNEADVLLLTNAAGTLAFISKNDPSTMSDSLSCLLRTARRTSNNKSRTFIVSSIALFGPSAISPLMTFLDSEVKNPPPEDPDTTTTQGLVSFAIINMVTGNPHEVDAVLEQLKKCLDTASDKLKPIIIVQIANLSPDSKSVVGILQEQLQSSKDPAYKKQIQAALDFARQKSPK